MTQIGPNRSTSHWPSWTMACLLCCVSTAIAAQADRGPVLKLSEATVLNRAEVYFEDIAECLDASALCDELSGVRILESVEPGARINLSREQLQAVLRAEFPSSNFLISGAQSVEIRATIHRLTPPEIERHIVSKLDVFNSNWKSLRLTLKRFKTLGVVTARDDKYQLSVPLLEGEAESVLRSLASGVGGWISLSAALVDDSWRQDFKLNVQIELESLLPVARTNLDAGRLIEVDDLQMEWKKLRRFEGEKQPSIDDLVGKQLSRRIGPGESISQKHLRKTVAIARGNAVKLMLSNGGISLSSDAKALQAGSVGEEIEVQVIATKKKIFAKIIDSKTVQGRF